MTKVALFPGCFDPFHFQHQKVVEKTLKQFKLDQIWILINQSSKEKKIIASFAHRWQMINNVFSNHSQIKVWPKPISYYTTYLIKRLKKKYPNTEFYLILGSDQMNLLNQWEHAKDLHQITKLICAPRLEYKPDEVIVKKYHVLKLKHLVINNFNSQSIKSGWNWSFLPKQTIAYILQHRLYFDNILKIHFNDDEERLKHSYAVAKLTLQLAKRFNYKKPLDLLYIGALFHDLAKFWTKEQHLAFWKKHNLQLNQLKNNPFPVWHAYTGAYYLVKEMQIKDPEIFNAVFYHTTGSIKMKTIAKFLFIADKLEPNKNEKAFVKARKQLQNKTITLEKLFQNTVVAAYQQLKINRKIPNQDLKTLYAQHH